MVAYKSMASLEEYVLVMQDEMRVEVYRRKGTEWEARIFTDAQEQLQLSSVSLSLSVSEIYRNVRLPEIDAD
jgi:Uma2 family endonuclease